MTTGKVTVAQARNSFSDLLAPEQAGMLRPVSPELLANSVCADAENALYVASVVAWLLVHKQRLGAASGGVRAGGFVRHDGHIQAGAQGFDILGT